NQKQKNRKKQQNPKNTQSVHGHTQRTPPPMKIETSFPIAQLSGTVSNSQLSFSTVQGEVVARAKVIPANPNSPEQLLSRSYITAATKNWDTLTTAQREAWEAYARTYFVTDDR